MALTIILMAFNLLMAYVNRDRFIGGMNFSVGIILAALVVVKALS